MARFIGPKKGIERGEVHRETFPCDRGPLLPFAFARGNVIITSGRWIAVTTVFGVGLSFISAARSDSASDVCAALVDARTALYSMMNAKEKSAQDALNDKVRAASTRVDTVLADMTGAGAKGVADFKAVWDQFKTTRDEEIIPAIYRGNTDNAKRIADGIQYERLAQMWSIFSCR